MSVLPADEETWLRERYWHVQAGDVVIDVGCYEGSWSIPALEAGATVYAIDARTQPLEALRAVAEANGLDARLTTIHRAISDGKPYPAELVEAIETGPTPSRGMVPAATWCTLDTLIAYHGIDRIDWIKVDVEGGEVAVLRGAWYSLLKHHPRLVVEDHSQVYPLLAEQDNTARLRGLLKLLKYEHELVNSYPDYLIASPRSKP